MKLIVRCFLILGVALAGGFAFLFVRGARHSAEILERFPPPGRMVDVGGRRLHLLCRGPARPPTVVFEGGAFGSSVGYFRAQDEVAKVAHVCVYDRAGLGWSDSTELPRSLEARVDDLHSLLSKGEVRPPYILAGHSLGGLLARMYRQKYSGDVAGLILIESSEEQINGKEEYEKESAQTVGQLEMGVLALKAGFEIPQVRIPDGPPEQDIIQRPSVFLAAKDDFVAMSHLSAELRAFGGLKPLGDLPLVVVQQGKFNGMHEPKVQEWKDAQIRNAKLSTRNVMMIAQRSGHNVMLDRPDVYREAVEKILEMMERSGHSEATATIQPRQSASVPVDLPH